jgi:hypothetical protein
MIKYLVPSAASLALIAVPAFAEVKNVSEQGFLSAHGADVLAKPEDVWKRLLTPKDWWNKAHSWSGSVDGFYIDAQAGGCFCELVQDKDKDGKIVNKGSVEHMRVIFSQPGRVLRMQGALGPLQSEAVLGTLTVAIEPSGTGSKLSFSYMVGGYSRFPMDKMAPAVDRVLAEQFASLIKPFGKIAVEPMEDAKAKAKPVLVVEPIEDEKSNKLEEAIEAIEPEKPAPEAAEQLR